MNESAGAKFTSEMQIAFEKWYRLKVCYEMDIQTAVAWDHWQVAWNAALKAREEGTT